MTTTAHPPPPATLEGWYSLCVVSRFDRHGWRRWDTNERDRALASARSTLLRITAPEDQGWSALVTLAGNTSDVLLLHLRPTLEEIIAVEQTLAREPLWEVLTPTFTFLSVTEVALYALSSQLLDETLARGGEVGDALYSEVLAARLGAEREVSHVERRLYPRIPQEMPYVCFYPMSKRRHAPHNWYALPLSERDGLMRAHGVTGRRYRGRIAQIVTGATGFEEWEWGVTLFARDALDIKHVVTDMRYDPASAEYAEFGDFFVGVRSDVETWLGMFE